MNVKTIFGLTALLFLNFATAQTESNHTNRPTTFSPPPPALTSPAPTSSTIEETENALETTEKSPEYPGGINAFRTKISNLFDASSVKGTGRISSECTFVIEKDGSMSNIKVSGNNESMNNEFIRLLRAIAKKEKWEPAQHKGQPVRYRMRLPLTMVLD